MRSFARGLLLVAISAVSHAACADRAPRLTLHVEEIGAGERTIVVLHGGPGVRHNYLRPEWDRLASSARVIYYDQRGCGLSTPIGPHHWRQHVADLNSIVDSLAPDRRVVLAASSWGTTLALLYTLRYPTRVDALVLSGLPGWPDAAGLASGFRHQSKRRQHMYAELQTRPVASRVLRDSAAAANSGGFHPTLAPRIGTMCTGAGEATFFSLQSAPSKAELHRIQVPTLIIRGTRDLTRGADSVASTLANDRVVTIRGAGHDPWVDQPDQFFALVEAFLDADSTRVP